ncbi:MAG TPA: DnaD domain protein [Bacilli bacterium]|nr:DnaD domain protein [Bacilli bacterium]
MKKMEDYLLADHFVVVIPDIITPYEQKILTYLYAPFLGPQAKSLYTTFYSLVKPGETESEMMSHSAFFNIMQIKKPEKFLEDRSVLEALGLLETYFYETKDGEPNRYIYLMKRVLDPYAFSQDPNLSHLLRAKIGDETYEKIMVDLLIRNFDINKFQNISKAFDEVFTITEDLPMIDFSAWWVDAKNKGVRVKNVHQQFENIKVQLLAQGDWAPEVLNDPRLKTETNRYCFFYCLTTEEMAQAILLSATSDYQIDYEKLPEAVKIVYANKKQPVAVKKIGTVLPKANSELVKKLETTSPAKVFEGKTGTELLPNEIQIFDQLQRKTGVSIGIINVLMLYVLEEKGGEVPSYNFYLKILNTWIRKGIKTTEEALRYINSTPLSRKSPRKEKPVPEWFDKHMEEAKKREEEERKKQESEENMLSMEELEAIFKPKKKAK